MARRRIARELEAAAAARAAARAGPAPPASEPLAMLRRRGLALGPHLFLVNAREDLVENVCRAIAEGLRGLGPEIVPARPGGGDVR